MWIYENFCRWENRDWGNVWESLDISTMPFDMEPGSGDWIIIPVNIALDLNIPTTTETGLLSGSLSFTSRSIINI